MKVLFAAYSFCWQSMQLAIIFMLIVLAGACNRPVNDVTQGYVEGNFVYIGSPLPGALESIEIQRGASVKAGDTLFVLDSALEKAARDEAEQRLSRVRATIEDAKGKQPATEANTTKTDAISQTDPAANDEINLRMLEAEVAKAKWNLNQKRQTAPSDAFVIDTLYSEGELVPAGRPVIVLLPPKNIKVRTFLNETRLGTLHVNDPVRVTVDGVPEPFAGKISFISPHAEYTPPVIYSKDNRGKLVYMTEVAFDDATAAKLHPGQPVEIQFGL